MAIYYKVIKTKTTVDVYEYECPPFQGVKAERNWNNTSVLQEWVELQERKPDNKTIQNVVKSLEEFEEEKKENARKYYAYKRRESMIRLINNNFDRTSKFLTLTFKENFQDVDEANYRHTKFIGKIRARYPTYKYLSVIEFQKRGAIHYHLLQNMYIYHKILESIWGKGRGKNFNSYGFIKIKRTDRVKNLGLYMTKYLTKHAENENIKGKKKFSMSRNMIKPEVLEGHSVSDAGRLSRYAKDNYVLINEYPYESKWQGKVCRKSYYIPYNSSL